MMACSGVLTAVLDPAEQARAKQAAVKAAAADARASSREKDKAPAAEPAGDAGSDACGVCQRNYGEDEAIDHLWIACDQCNSWYHGTCVGATQVTAPSSAYFWEWHCSLTILFSTAFIEEKWGASAEQPKQRAACPVSSKVRAWFPLGTWVAWHQS